MIHKLLTLTRPLIILDTETTGPDTQKDRIIELGFQMWTAEGLAKEYRTLVNPGIPILNAVTGKHGITDVHVQGCSSCVKSGIEAVLKRPTCREEHPVSNEGFISSAPDGVKGPCMEFKPWPTFKQLAANLAKGFTDCDYGGKNPRFDLRITAEEMKRNDQPWSYADARIIDADRLEAWLNKRSLSHLYRKYTGLKLEGAHGALIDVQASTTVIVNQLGQLTQNEDEAVPLPRDLDALHALQWPGWIDPDGKFKFIDGVPCFSQWGKYAGRAMKDADVGYWDFVLRSDFGVDVKALAGNAKLGKFPVQKG